MPLNTLEFASKFAGELDKRLIQDAQTGFFADNALKSKFVGAKTVIIPDMQLQGLANYDRDNGFTGGSIAINNTSYTLTMDRARSFMLDPVDADETGVANLTGQILKDFVKYHVSPEVDSYVLSKLSSLAIERGNTVTVNSAKPYQAFTSLLTEAREKAGYSRELICFLEGRFMAAFENSTEFSRQITVSDFKQGDVNLKVKSINGITLIPVTSERMKSAYTFNADGEGGFTPTEDAVNVQMILMPKNAAHLIRKHEAIRIFSPSENINADAYKFDYRLFYDILVKKSELDTIWAGIPSA